MKTPFPTPKELLVMWLIKDGHVRGLEIVQASRKKIGRTNVYVYLGRLEEKGLIDRTSKNVYGMALQRPTYALTGAGRAVIGVARLLGWEPFKRRGGSGRT